MERTKKIIFYLVLLCFISANLFAISSKTITLTVLYDNYKYSEGTREDGGFACLIEGTEKTILFDAGTRSNILEHNMRELKKDPRDITHVVISHDHGDHTGGLLWLLDYNTVETVLVPSPLGGNLSEEPEKKGIPQIHAKAPLKIMEKVHLTGEMIGRAHEQALVLETSKGLVIVTGCSHPGIVKMVKKAKEMIHKNIYLVMGGFHLIQHSDAELDTIIEEFKKIGVEKLGATHCTGDRAIEKFKKAWGKNFITMGTGKTLKVR